VHPLCIHDHTRGRIKATAVAFQISPTARPKEVELAVKHRSAKEDASANFHTFTIQRHRIRVVSEERRPIAKQVPTNAGVAQANAARHGTTL